MFTPSNFWSTEDHLDHVFWRGLVKNVLNGLYLNTIVNDTGSAKEPQGNSCRSMFVIGYFIAYLIFTAFAAGITSLLAVTSDRPETQWEEALSSDMSYVTLCGSDGHSYLEVRQNNTVSFKVPLH